MESDKDMVTAQLSGLSARQLVLFTSLPQKSLEVAWQLLRSQLTQDQAAVADLRACGLLDLLLEKVTYYQWQELRSMWRYLTVGELTGILLRTFRARTGPFSFHCCEDSEILRLVFEHPETTPDDIFLIMHNVPMLREQFMPVLLERGPGLVHLIQCLGMREVWEQALDALVQRSVEHHPEVWREGLRTQERKKHLPATSFTRLLSWQLEQKIITKEELERLSLMNGYKLAVQRIMKELPVR